MYRLVDDAEIASNKPFSCSDYERASMIQH